LYISGHNGITRTYIDLKNISFHKIQKHIWKIIPEPITEFQVRFIFLQIDDMEMMDLAGT
jgi:hypothetical protein